MKKIKKPDTLSIETKNKLLDWCKVALKDSISKEEFENSNLYFNLITAIENNDDLNIEKCFNKINVSTK